MRHAPAILCLSLLVACGGGGGSSGGPDPDPDPPPVPGSFALSGRMSAAGDAAIDSDTADPTVARVSNNFTNTAQIIRNPVTLGGYANKQTDEFDVFQVELAPGQVINLFIAEDGAANDLDLTLADSNLNIVDQSLDTGKFESLIVPGSSTATYFIQVNAFVGASNYVLTITQPGASTSAPSPISAMSTQAEFVPGQVLVQFSAADDSAVQSGAKSLAESMGGDWLAGVPGGVDLLDMPSVRAKSQGAADFNGFRVADPELEDRIATLIAIKAMARQPGVDYAEPNLIRRTFAVPNDAFFGQQWHYNLINLPQAWDITTGSPDVIVAVADTGVRLNHPDLVGKFDPLDPTGFDFVSDPARSLDGDGIDGNADDPGDGGLAGNSSFHGTHVAGTIAAATDNNFGAAGVGWDTRIMPLRVLGANGSGSSFDIQNAVLYAAGLNNSSGQLPPRAADIINLSLGSDTPLQSEQAAYAAAVNAGLIVIAAAGNSGDSRQSFPASYPGVVSVGAVGRQKQRAPYSQFNSAVDVAAPGGDQSRANPDGVLSTLSSDSSLPIRDGVGFLQGTSMAAPHMAGVVALMKAVNPALTPAQLDQLLASGAITEDLGTPGRDNAFGHGLIDANLAVREAIRLANGQAPADNPRLSVQPDSLNFGSVLTTATVDVANAGTGALTVTSFSDDATWLSVTAQTIDDDGLGRYQVAVDRSGLANGTYAATLTFTSAINTVSVPVLISVGQVSGRVDAGKQYVLLVDANTSTALDQDEVTITSDGTYAFSFQNLPEGSYQLISGTDSDNDGFICDDGEACGAFPALDSPLPVVIDGASRSNLDFLVSFGLSTPDLQGGVRAPQVGYRLLDRRHFE